MANDGDKKQTKTKMKKKLPVKKKKKKKRKKKPNRIAVNPKSMGLMNSIMDYQRAAGSCQILSDGQRAQCSRQSD